MAKERITQRIIEEARARAAEIVAGAEENAKAASLKVRQEADAASDAILSKAKNDATEKQRRAVVVAELESRKNELAVKRGVLDAAYEKATAAFRKLDAPAYQNAYLKIVLASLSKGTESIAPAEKDKDTLGADFIKMVNKALQDKGMPGDVKLSDARRDIDGGLVILDAGMEINYSVESVMRSCREETEGDVAKILFQAKEG